MMLLRSRNLLRPAMSVANLHRSAVAQMAQEASATEGDRVILTLAAVSLKITLIIP